MKTIELTQIPDYCKTKDFDLMRINYKVGEIGAIQEIVRAIVGNHEMVLKDGYKTYEAIGMQYADPNNPLYDAVQQTAFVSDKSKTEFRKPARYKEQNEIGKEFDFVHDAFAKQGIGLERGRILKANPGHIHNDHLDYDVRIHLPVFSNPECKMSYSGNLYHMVPDGSIYLINGYRLHHFFNKGDTERIHLVWLIERELYA